MGTVRGNQAETAIGIELTCRMTKRSLKLDKPRLRTWATGRTQSSETASVATIESQLTVASYAVFMKINRETHYLSVSWVVNRW